MQNITDEEAEKELAEINGELPPENDAELALYGQQNKQKGKEIADEKVQKETD
ncbi:hypothetical protein ABG808_07475 [Streptococcus iniae]